MSPLLNFDTKMRFFTTCLLPRALVTDHSLPGQALFHGHRACGTPPLSH